MNCLTIGMHYETSGVAFFWDMTQKMEIAYSSKMLVPISQATQNHIPQQSTLLNLIIVVLGSTLNKAGY